jgi:hypothetical protein
LAMCGLVTVGGNTGHSCGQRWTGWMPGSSPFSSFATYCQSRPKGGECPGGSIRPRNHRRQRHASLGGHPLVARPRRRRRPGSRGLTKVGCARRSRDASPYPASNEAGQCNPGVVQGLRVAIGLAQAVRGLTSSTFAGVSAKAKSAAKGKHMEEAGR